MYKRQTLKFNLSRLPVLTQSDILDTDTILADYRIDELEREKALDILTRSNITEAEKLVDYLEDGVIFDVELSSLNETLLEEEGITLEFRRAWHNRLWLPQLPAGQISLEYDFRIIDDIPHMSLIYSLVNGNRYVNKLASLSMGSRVETWI